MGKGIVVIILVWSVIMIGLYTIDIYDRLRKLEQKDSFTVVCDKYKYRPTTLDFVGYDCKILGGKHEL